ncbi:MAG: putative porin, partial [Burkholderiales bacterium]
QQEGLLSRDRADALLRKTAPRPSATPTAATTAPATAAVSPGAPPAGPGVRDDRPAASREPVRVQYVPDQVRQELKAQLKAEVLEQARTERWGDPGTLPDWMRRLNFEAELRLREQFDRYANGNAPASVLFDDSYAGGQFATNFADVTNSNVDRQRLRLRARFGVSSQINEEWAAALRLSTGSLVGPVSTSSTSGDPSDRYGIKLDRAFLRYAPTPWATLTAGRAPNPYFSSEMQFAPDLGFDGASAALAADVGGGVRAFGTAGWFVLRENSLTADRTMLGLQVGASWAPTDSPFGVRVGFARYDYRNIEGVSDTTNFGTPLYASTEYERGYRQKGNTLFRINNAPQDTSASRYGLASGFAVDALTMSFDFRHFDPVAINYTFEGIRNGGWNADDIAARTGGAIPKLTRGVYHRIQVGSQTIRRKADWQIFGGWRDVQADATPDALTDPEFMLGGTNVKGFWLGANYGLDRNLVAGLRWFSGRQSASAPLSAGLPYAVDILQLDISARF